MTDQQTTMEEPTATEQRTTDEPATEQPVATEQQMAAAAAPRAEQQPAGTRELRDAQTSAAVQHRPAIRAEASAAAGTGQDAPLFDDAAGGRLRERWLAIQTGGWGWWVVAGMFALCSFAAGPAVGWVARTPRIGGTPAAPLTEAAAQAA